MVPEAKSRPHVEPGRLPAHVETAIWRGDELGTRITSVVSSGFAELDRELPGGGWPCHSVTEILSPQPSVLEWRLLAPALRTVVAAGGQIVVIGPPKWPHLPGLLHSGIDARHLVWLKAETPAERLWCTEQLIRANAAGALLSWLPLARQEQLRRLQVRAQASDGPVFLFRPTAAMHEASPAPLRVEANFGCDWELRVRLLKRRGANHEGTLMLPSIPGGLASVLTPRSRRPSVLISSEVAHAMGRTQASDTPHVAAH